MTTNFGGTGWTRSEENQTLIVQLNDWFAPLLANNTFNNDDYLAASEVVNNDRIKEVFDLLKKYHAAKQANKKFDFRAQCRLILHRARLQIDPATMCPCGKEKKVKGYELGAQCRRNEQRRELAKITEPIRIATKKKKDAKRLIDKKAATLLMRQQALDASNQEVETAQAYLSDIQNTIGEADDGDEREECPICREPLAAFEGDNRVTRCQPVPHKFHAYCLDVWVATHPTCPTCRQEI